MIFSYNWLKEYVTGKMPEPKKLVAVLTFHSFEIKGVKKSGGDFLLDIDVLPNRAHDCFSHIGVAREIAVLLNSKFKIQNSKLQFKIQKFSAKDFVGVEVERAEDCPRYTAAVVLGVRVGQSPKWMQDRLTACGLQPINNIVDITNYVMLETGQPLHAFDFFKIKSVQNQKSKIKNQNENSKCKMRQIIVRRAKKGERIKTLDDKTYTLDEDILVIADDKKPIAIAGIKGGVSTGIDKKTKDIVIEAANFNPVLTRKASQRLKLRTDASMRFEQGIDPNLIDFAQARVCSLIKEIAGGKAAKGLVDFYLKKVKPKTIILDLNYAESLLGVKIPKEKIIKILGNLGFGSRASGASLIVEVPTRRVDVSIPEDLIEEICRIYGYQNIPSVFPVISLASAARNEDFFWENKVKNILKEAGFCEAYGYSFCGEKEREIFALKDLVEIVNPVSVFNKYLRKSLITNLVKVAKENLKNFDEVKIFETGAVFSKKPQGATARSEGVEEKKMLSGFVVKKGGKDEVFYELKGAMDILFNGLGVSDVWYDTVKATPEDSPVHFWHPGKTAEVKVGDVEIGFLGELHPKIAECLGLKERVFFFDINLGKLTKAALEESEYQPISPHPAVLRDIAVLVPQGTKVAEAMNIIYTIGGELVRDVDLFDIYSSQDLGEGRENFAFHIIYQSEKKTLSSLEVDKVHQKIVRALEENPEWEVRR